MMKNSYKMLFLMILMMSTIITVSANSWLNAWMGLEINLLAFIPLMNDINNLKSSEASLKYFLAQALASSILLFTILMMMMKFNMTFQMNIQNNEFFKMSIMSSLLMKSGTAPFHFWFTEVAEGLSWISNLIMMTWQKIAPMMLMSYLITTNMFMYSIIVITSFTGSIQGMNMTSLRKLMAFSSINHLGWMLTAMMINQNIWMIYFMFYCLLNATVVMMFNMYKIFHFNQMFSNYITPTHNKMFMMINLLSLGGLPPFMGFIPKWIVIQYLTENNMNMINLLLIMSTLISLYFYLRMTFSATMMNYNQINWFKSNIQPSKQLMIAATLSSISIMSLPSVSLMFFML